MTLRGVRVLASDGVTFPPELKVFELRLDGLPGSKDFAITRRGAYIGNDSSSFELFQGDTRFRPARWPAVGFSHDIKLDTDKKGVILSPEIFARFSGEPDLWLGAYWTADWAFETSRVATSVASQRKLIFDPLKAPQTIRPSFPFYLFNAFAAISKPGDYVLNEARNTVYAAAINDSDTFEVSVEKTLLEINGAHDLHVNGLKLQKGLGTALVIRNSENVTIEDCDIRHMGRSAIVVEGGRNVAISSCKIDDIAETAVEMSGGDRNRLTPAGHVIRNSEITNFDLDARGYHPGIQISGVGILVKENTISDSPHAAIVIKGNDHRIEGNKIYRVVTEADDAGAIYVGRDWSERGTVIQGNWLHDIGYEHTDNGLFTKFPRYVMGIYLDDQESGYSIIGNLFEQVGRPVLINGGRDNRVEKNVFLHCIRGGILAGYRGEGFTGGILQKRLEAVPFKSKLWAERYPQLAEIENNHPSEPLNNSEQQNIAIGCPLYYFPPATDPSFWPDIGKKSLEIKEGSLDKIQTIDTLRKSEIWCRVHPDRC